MWINHISYDFLVPAMCWERYVNCRYTLINLTSICFTAGRRGYDLLGKVVFYGLPTDRCQRLVLSKLPSLGGSFPMTSTMVLRLFSLLQGSGYEAITVTAVQRLMTLPHISFVSDSGKHQLLHHVRFSIDYLIRAGLLDNDGNPIDLSGIASHLYYTEPSNLALIALLRGGFLHQICSQPSRLKAKRDFMIMMAHLFNRKKLPKVYTSAENVKRLIKKSPSVVILPPLPESAKRLLFQHDADILKVFAGYAHTFAVHHRDEIGPDHTLPLSGRSYLSRSESSDNDERFSRFHLTLRKSALHFQARSVFVANSGHADDFDSISELCGTVREGLHLADHAIPSMEQFTNSDDDFLFTLNAYLLDFYTHGQVQPLISANGIRRGDLWYLFQDFTLVLKTIRSSLERLLLGVSKGMEEDDNDLDGTESITAVDPAEFDEDTQGSEGTRGGSIVSPKTIDERDRQVLEVIGEVTDEFEEKFKAMWA